jgi:hypothetical protein
MIRVLVVGVAGVGLLAGISGCNTEEMWAEKQELQGPVTDLASPQGVELPDLQMVDVREIDLVEQVLRYRAMYARSLRLLHDYYEEHGYSDKRRWASAELADLERIRPFKYIVSAEIPTASLQARDSIAEADELYDRAGALMENGGHHLPVLYRQDKMREALRIYTELISTYPTSDKIDDAAFQCGEITKEYFQDQEPIAVKWYERAFTWDPQTPHAARFQAAVIYDYRMHDRARALELYHAVLDHETHNQSNAVFASRRIFELTQAMHGTAPELADGDAPAEDVPAADEEITEQQRIAAEQLIPTVQSPADRPE